MDEVGKEFVKDVYSSRDLRLADPRFLDIWPRLKEEYGLKTGYELCISCTYRSPKAQNDLYQIGRTAPGKIVTNCDGQTNISNHNKFPSTAIDVFPTLAGKVAIWDKKAFEPLLELAIEFGLKWGGVFEGKFKDLPHLELL